MLQGLWIVVPPPTSPSLRERKCTDTQGSSCAPSHMQLCLTAAIGLCLVLLLLCMCTEMIHPSQRQGSSLSFTARQHHHRAASVLGTLLHHCCLLLSVNCVTQLIDTPRPHLFVIVIAIAGSGGRSAVCCLQCC